VKAAVYYGAGDIRIENVSEPAVEPDGIVIQVKACGICGSDLHIYKLGGAMESELLMSSGLIMGHEFSGDVVEVGANVTDIKKGDRVIATGWKPCGECHWCQMGQPLLCRQIKIIGIGFPGAFAEYVSIPTATLDLNVFRLADEISYEVGATAEPLSVAVYAATTAEPVATDTVVVLGAGMIGQCVLQVFKAMGVAKVIVTETSKKRLELARAMGADMVINAAEEDPVERVNEATSEMGADIVVECAGVPATFHQAMEMVRRGGKIMQVGVYEEPIQWEPITLITKNIRLIGCLGGGFLQAIEFLGAGKVNTKPLISHEFPLDKAKEAFETQLKPDEAVKIVIKP